MCIATTLVDICIIFTCKIAHSYNRFIYISFCFCWLSVCCYCFLHILFLRQAVPVKKFDAGTNEKPRYAADDIEVLLSFVCVFVVVHSISFLLTGFSFVCNILNFLYVYIHTYVHMVRWFFVLIFAWNWFKVLKNILITFYAYLWRKFKKF